MKIILAVADYKGKNVVFVSDTFQVFSLEEAARLVKSGVFEDISLVRRGGGVYLRTKKKIPKERELGNISLTSTVITAFAQGFVTAKTTAALSRYLELYRASLAGSEEFIVPRGEPEASAVPAAAVRDALVVYQELVFQAAEKFSIDPLLLGAILIDEIARRHPFEKIFDSIKLHGFGLNTSVGIAQVTTDTANSLIRKGVYNPNPDDPKLPFKRMSKFTRALLAPYLIDPKHSIFFAAALIRSFINDWHQFIDLSRRPEILGTLYHIGYKVPHGDPHSNVRGEQIAREFYFLAKKWLL